MTKERSRIVPIVGLATILLFYSTTVFGQDGWLKRGNDPDKYEMGFDKSVHHEGKKAMTIKSVAPIVEDFGTFMTTIIPGKYLGKRVRMTGYIKSSNLTGWAGLWLRVDKEGSDQSLAFDNMQNRPVKGTTDWNKYELVLDVPNEASAIIFGALLSGAGQIWFDISDLEIVDKSTPITGQ